MLATGLSPAAARWRVAGRNSAAPVSRAPAAWLPVDQEFPSASARFRVEPQTIGALRAGNTRHLAATIGIQHQHRRPYRDKQPMLRLIERESGGLRGGEVETLNDLAGLIDGDDLGSLLHGRKQHV